MSTMAEGVDGLESVQSELDPFIPIRILDRAGISDEETLLATQEIIREIAKRPDAAPGNLLGIVLVDWADKESAMRGAIRSRSENERKGFPSALTREEMVLIAVEERIAASEARIPGYNSRLCDIKLASELLQGQLPRENSDEADERRVIFWSRIRDIIVEKSDGQLVQTS